ncbi:LytR C-terminal domain-containing protein [Pseudarthrobacter sp. NPDC058362]|uniref:LytR C-terminal domain-containing protein n=1 Tax=Pseudarthrobacter sp. NPDC058362 TaxID=3346458 RepID=UPI00365577D5
MPKYARDEFDKVPEAASRQGVHRAATPPSRVRLWPILAAGAVALAIGAVAFLILPKLGFSPLGQTASSVEAPLADTGSSPSASAAPTETPSASATPSASTKPSATPSAEPVPEPTETAVSVDKTQPVAVYNAAGTAGLAGRVGSTVQADGWQLGQVANWSGAPQQASVIFYAGEAQQANAEALSALLGIPTVVSSSEFQAPLVVVLGPGYA